MLYGEFRESRVIDFVCPAGPVYRQLRNQISQAGYDALFDRCDGFVLNRLPRLDQYGVRFPICIDSQSSKFEIFNEARIALDLAEQPAWGPVGCLSTVDAFAEKLLANTDRWADRSVASRALIDLAFMRLAGPIPPRAFEKAEAAYAVLPSLEKAIARFQEYPAERERCISALKIENRVAAIDGLDLLAADLGLPATERIWLEHG